MKLNKSYRLLKFLNRHHSVPSRLFFGGVAWAGVLFVTGRWILAREIWRGLQADHFKLSLRRCGWYAATGWPRFRQLGDDFFDFTEGLNRRERDALTGFLERRRARLPVHVYLANALYVKAAALHERLEMGEQPLVSDVEDFYSNANALLAALPVARLGGHGRAFEPDRIGDFSIDDARKALSDFAELFPIEDWRWYVVSGTFLGLIREKGFLAHDYDIDLGVHAETLDLPLLLSRLEASPHFAIKKIDTHLAIHHDGKRQYILEKFVSMVKIVHAGGVNVDVFIHHKDKEVRWHGSVIHRWDNHDFELVEYDLEGVKVFGPENYDLYLTENYGSWRTPVKKFDCTTGTPNLVIARNFLSIALFLKRLSVFSETEPASAKKLRGALIGSGVLCEKEGALVLKEYV